MALKFMGLVLTDETVMLISFGIEVYGYGLDCNLVEKEIRSVF